MPSRDSLRRDGTHDGTELSFTTMCNELVLIFPFSHFFMGLKVGNVEQLTSAASLRPPSRSPCFLLLASLLSRVSTGVLEPCHALPAKRRDADGRAAQSRINAHSLSSPRAREGGKEGGRERGRRNTSSKREGGVTGR